MGNYIDSKNDQGELTYLPIINSKYQPISLLGSGAFGRVIKVSTPTTPKSFYAMKISCDVSSKKNHDEKTTYHNEKNILEYMKPNKHIIKFHDFFTVDKCPLLGKKGLYHCLVIEYCQGNDLSNLLESQVNIPYNIVVKWFIAILKTFKEIHRQKVVHRDVKPDNILLSSRDFEGGDEGGNVILKISDFGSACRIGKEDMIKGKRGCHMFYVAKEMMKENVIDTITDIWSIGIVFMQVVAKISISRFEKIIKEVFHQEMNDEKERNDMLKEFELKSIEEVTYFNMLCYIHKRDLLWNKIVVNYIDDQSVLEVLKLMICDKTIRWSASQLLENKILKSWNIISNKIVEKYDDVDMSALMSFIKFKSMLPTCFEILLSVNDYDDFLKINNGIEFLFKEIEFEKHFVELIKILVKIMIYDKSTVGIVYQKIKENYYVETIRKNLIDPAAKESDNWNYLFTYFLVRHSPSFAISLLGTLKSLFKKVNTYNENKFIFSLIELMIPYCDDDYKISEYLDVYKNNDVLFFKGFAKSETILSDIFERIKRNIVNKTELEGNMLILLHLVIGKDLFKYIHNIQLKIEKPLTKHCVMNYFSVPEICNVVLDISENCTMISCKTSEKANIELISSEQLVSFSTGINQEEKFTTDIIENNSCIGYYEIQMVYSGLQEDFKFGLYIESKDKEKKIFYHCKTGDFYLTSKGDELIKQTIDKCVPYTKSVMGIGITDNGTVFLTYNNDLLKPFMKINLDDKSRIHALVKINGNDQFKCRTNFNEKNFHFNFKKEISSYVSLEIMNVLKDYFDEGVFKFYQRKYKSNDFILYICEKILKCFSNKKIIVDEKLIQIFKEFGYYSNEIINVIAEIEKKIYDIENILDIKTFHVDIEKDNNDFFSELESVSNDIDQKKKFKLKNLFASGGEIFTSNEEYDPDTKKK